MPDGVPPGEVIRRHLDACLERGLRPATIDQRRGHLTRLRRHLLKRDPPVDLLTATAADLEWWTASLAERSSSYRALALQHVRSFYRWAGECELADPRLRVHAAPRAHRLPVDADTGQ